MSSKGIVEALNELEEIFDPQRTAIHVPDGYYYPGYLVALTAFAHSKNTPQGEIYLPDKIEQYIAAVGISIALWGIDTYEQNRTNNGGNYSMMTHLVNAEAVDIATQEINGCIRRLADDYAEFPGVVELQQVVGELHDNVWSHGKASGFSMAQKSKVPREDDNYLEFALVDCGLGFLEETRRASMDKGSHKEAILWCIEEGHSTKHGDNIDPLAQRLPDGFTGDSPFGGGVETRDSDNHHQGLGLAKLCKLVSDYKGELFIASGDTCFNLDSGGNKATFELDYEWSGVAISCRLRESELRVDLNDTDDGTLELMDQLRA